MAEVFPNGYPRPFVCVECGTAPISPESVLYCDGCIPVPESVEPDDNDEAEREEAYYVANPDKRPSLYADDPGSVGGI